MVHHLDHWQIAVLSETVLLMWEGHEFATFVYVTVLLALVALGMHAQVLNALALESLSSQLEYLTINDALPEPKQEF